MSIKAAEPEVYGFVITKPLQLMVVLAIIEQLPDAVKKELLIIDYFAGAKEVSQRLAEVKYPDCSVSFLADDAKAFELARKKKFAKLFIDSDVGFFRNLTLIYLVICSRHTILAVYEEGLGTYRTDLYKGLKKKILQQFGCGVFFGGNWLTKELFIYEPSKYGVKKKSVKINKIHRRISDLLVGKKDILRYIFSADKFLSRLTYSGESGCIIYLSGWYIDGVCLDLLRESKKMIYVKLHPHIKTKVADTSNYYVADSGIPAEIILSELSAVYSDVVVIHHGSSVDRYIKNANIRYVLVDDFKSGRLSCC